MTNTSAITFIIAFFYVISLYAQTESPLLVYTGHGNNRIFCGALSPDGSLAATGSGDDDRSIHLWYTETGYLKFRIDMPSTIHSIEFSPEGESIIATIYGTFNESIPSFAVLIEATTGKELWRFAYSDNYNTVARFMPDGDHILAALTKLISEPFIFYETYLQIMKIQNHKIISTSNKFDSHIVWDLNISPTGYEILAGFLTVYPIRPTAFSSLIDVRQWKPRTDFLHSTGIFSPKGRALVTNELPPSKIYNPPYDAVYILNLDDLSVVRHFGSGKDLPMAFTPNGRYLITAQDDWIRFWNVSTGNSIASIHNPVPVRFLSLSGNGNRMICGNPASNNVYVWDISDIAQSNVPEGEWKEYEKK